MITTDDTIPDIFTLDPMVGWLVERDQELTSDELGTVLSRLGRNDGPALLVDLAVQYGLVSDEVLAEHIGSVWSAAEFPEYNVDRAWWLMLFEAAGYTVDGKPAERPSEPIRLYRGSDFDHRHRMAWTSSLTTAQWFTDRPIYSAPGQVWTAMVEPWRLQCALLDSTAGRGEAEYVIDPGELDIGRWSE